MRKYYEAYDERYKDIHQLNEAWTSNEPTKIVYETILKHHLPMDSKMLEIGCGEGRDSVFLLDKGYDLVAVDISSEVIRYNIDNYSEYKDSFKVVNVISDKLDCKFDYIFSIAVIHMLVEDDDRKGFYQFISKHLSDNGIALICTMGDGNIEVKSDITEAFDKKEREHSKLGKVLVAATSCNMVSWDTFNEELASNSLEVIESGITEAMPEFNCLMYAVVKRK